MPVAADRRRWLATGSAAAVQLLAGGWLVAPSARGAGGRIGAGNTCCPPSRPPRRCAPAAAHPPAASSTAAAPAAASRPAAPRPWPAGPIRILLVYPPGGVSDGIVRLLADRLALALALAMPVRVEYRPGASGSLGLEALAAAAPDGQTLAFSATSPLTLYPQLVRMRYDLLRDIVPVASVMLTPSLLVGTPAFAGRSARRAGPAALGQHRRRHHRPPGAGAVAAGQPLRSHAHPLQGRRPAVERRAGRPLRAAVDQRRGGAAAAHPQRPVQAAGGGRTAAPGRPAAGADLGRVGPSWEWPPPTWRQCSACWRPRAQRRRCSNG